MTPHADLGGFLLGRLETYERARYERHLADCPECQGAAEELRGVVALAERAAPVVEIPADLRARTLAAVERAAAGDERAAERPALTTGGRARSWRPSRLALAGAAATAAIAAGAFVGIRLVGDDATAPPEVKAVLTPPGGGGEAATLEARKTGIGRVVMLASDDLPVLPTGQFYELWFVGPGDTPASPNRISAGTFHPDPQGRSDVQFAAAVDPAKYPELSVTRESGDGDPRPGREVLRSAPAP